MIQFQQMQNKATRLITNTRRIDRVPLELLHTFSELEPINIVTHKQAQKIWQNIHDTLGINIRNTVSLLPHSTFPNTFPSSYNRAQQAIPAPLYV